MESINSITAGIIGVIFFILCEIVYHKMFTVYYLGARAIGKEIIVCILISCFLTGIAMYFAIPLAFIILIVGFLWTRSFNSQGLRIVTNILIVAISIILFILGFSVSKAKKADNINQPEVLTNYSENIDDINIPQETSFTLPNDNQDVNYTQEITESAIIEEYPIDNSEIPEVTQDSTLINQGTIFGIVTYVEQGLNIRTAPGIHNDSVGHLFTGEHVEIFEQCEFNGMTWGRIDRGWISMDYISIGSNSVSSVVNRIGYVTGSFDGVNIRSGPSIDYAVIGKAYLGQQVTITELQHNGVSEWGYIGNGWICTDYISWDEPLPGTDYYEEPIIDTVYPTESTPIENEFVGYDCYGNELYVGNIVRLGTRANSTEYAIGTITACLGGYLPIVEFTEICDDNGLSGSAEHYMDGLADKIREYGSYSCEVEAQYLQIHIWG